MAHASRNPFPRSRSTETKAECSMRKLLTMLLLALSLLYLRPEGARAQRGMTPEDTLRVAAVADAQVSPDGARVVYTVSTVSGNETRTALWLARTNDPQRASGQVIVGDLNPAHPRWSPDGTRI